MANIRDFMNMVGQDLKEWGEGEGKFFRMDPVAAMGVGAHFPDALPDSMDNLSSWTSTDGTKVNVWRDANQQVHVIDAKGRQLEIPGKTHGDVAVALKKAGFKLAPLEKKLELSMEDADQQEDFKDDVLAEYGMAGDEYPLASTLEDDELQGQYDWAVNELKNARTSGSDDSKIAALEEFVDELFDELAVRKMEGAK